jgi:hypothetical protein
MLLQVRESAKVADMIKIETIQDIAARIKRARAEREMRAEIHRDTKEVVEGAFRAPDASTFAAQVLRAAAKARGAITDDTPRFSNDEHGRRAKLICNAARRARGEEPYK